MTHRLRETTRSQRDRKRRSAQPPQRLSETDAHPPAPPSFSTRSASPRDAGRHPRTLPNP